MIKERSVCRQHKMNWQAICFETPDIDYIVSMVDMNVRAQMK